jgi:alpha-1,2-mannosyltransferase
MKSRRSVLLVRWLRLSAAPLLVLVGLVVVVIAHHGQPFGVDLWMRRVLAPSGQGAAGRLAQVATQLGAGPVLYVVLGALAAWRLRHRAGRPVWWAFVPVIALACSQVVESVLFVTLPRPSPAGDFAAGVAGGSFSSGHAAAATLGWGLVASAVSTRRRAGEHLPRAGSLPGAVTCWVAVAAGLVVGATRIALGIHWASDVLGAVSLGLLLLIASCSVDAMTRARGTDAPDGGTARVRRPPSSPWWWLVPAAVALLPVVSLLRTPGPERLKDLLVYQGAGGAAGAGIDVYGFRTVFDMPFTYPPFAALLSEPLSRLPVGLGQVLWTAGTLAALVALARVALVPLVIRLGLPLTVAALLLASPVRSHLRFGQVGVFLTLIVALDLLPTGRERRTRGLGLGVAIAVKLTPAVFLPWLVVTRSWGRLRATMAWLTGASLLGLLLLWRSASDYVFTASRDTARFGANDIPGNQSIRGMLLRTDLPDGWVSPCWLAVSLVLLAVATHGAWRLERAGQRLTAVAVLACLSVAVSPISWVHHLIWLALPIGALAAAGRWRIAAAWYAVLLPGLPALGDTATRAGYGPPVLWQLITDLQGLTAVAAVLVLPALCRPGSANRVALWGRAAPTAGVGLAVRDNG